MLWRESPAVFGRMLRPDKCSVWVGTVLQHSIFEALMLHYALVFLIVALVAAAAGFGGIAGEAAGIAKVLFFIFIVLFVLSLLMGKRGTAQL